LYRLCPNNFFCECLEDERLLIDSKGLHDVTHPHNGHQEKESQAVDRNGGAAGQTQHLKFQVLQLLLKDSVTITAIYMHDSEKNGMESSSFNMSGAIRALWSSPQC
jgi:hypothetical protein